ncbi:hypothetical protein SV7mr_16300 [Stieleria bergensis]|uniref:Uncharacterized protein n=1 Tax=Stieleria bergensis TaxID=2528025 RepID=A0A517SSQ3_9BACT|nr:hypothetical protein SV7mr_16300 [Planctomycetes bacterium SV_7m_r]
MLGFQRQGTAPSKHTNSPKHPVSPPAALWNVANRALKTTISPDVAGGLVSVTCRLAGKVV